MVELLPTLGSSRFSDGRLHEAGRSGDRHVGRDWERGPDGTLELHAYAGPEHHVLTSTVPALGALRGRPGAWSLAVLTTLGLVVGGFVLAYACLRRLLFLRLLSRLRHPLRLDFNELHELVREHQCVLIGGTCPDVVELARRCGKPLAEREPTLPGEQGPQPLFVVEDTAEWLEDPDKRRELGAAIEGGAFIVAFAERPPLEQAPESEQAEWAELLKEFHYRLAPPHRDEHLEAGAEPPDAYLLHVWRGLIDDERRVLAQLVVHGFITPHRDNQDSVLRLAQRGILNPHTLTLSNERMATFVRTRLTTEDLQKWEEPGTASAWERLKAPLYTAVGAIFVALGLSAPEVAMTGAMAPAVAAGVPLLLRMLAAVALAR